MVDYAAIKAQIESQANAQVEQFKQMPQVSFWSTLPKKQQAMLSASQSPENLKKLQTLMTVAPLPGSEKRQYPQLTPGKTGNRGIDAAYAMGYHNMPINELQAKLEEITKKRVASRGGAEYNDLSNQEQALKAQLQQSQSSARDSYRANYIKSGATGPYSSMSQIYANAGSSFAPAGTWNGIYDKPPGPPPPRQPFVPPTFGNMVSNYYGNNSIAPMFGAAPPGPNGLTAPPGTPIANNYNRLNFITKAPIGNQQGQQ